jgi:hypothetical protein
MRKELITTSLFREDEIFLTERQLATHISVASKRCATRACTEATSNSSNLAETFDTD